MRLGNGGGPRRSGGLIEQPGERPENVRHLRLDLRFALDVIRGDAGRQRCGGVQQAIGVGQDVTLAAVT